MQPTIYELPSGALATWRNLASTKPALVLFSTHPFLDPFHPDQSLDEIRKLVSTSTPEEIDQRSRSSHPSPLLIPTQAVSAGIAAGLFSQIVVVLPTVAKIDEMKLESFRDRLVAAGFLTVDEGAKLSLAKGVYSGTVRGVPFRYVHPEALPAIEAPVIVHIDTGYFKDLYKNEVSTPTYALLRQVAQQIRAAKYRALAATLSYSNQEIKFSLDIRFLIRNFAELIQKPALLDRDLPKEWELRAKAMALSAMFNESEALKLVETNARDFPDDADCQHALAMARFQQQRQNEAFAALDRAVTLDRGYAHEYVDLALQAKSKNLWSKALPLLDKAVSALPENPFIKIELVDTLIASGQGRKAIPALKELRQLPWSPLFHKQVPELLRQMEEVAMDEQFNRPAPDGQTEAPAPPVQNRRPAHMGGHL